MVSHLSFLRSLNWYRGLPTLGQIQFELSDRVWRLFTYGSRIRQNSPESFRPHGFCLKKGKEGLSSSPEYNWKLGQGTSQFRSEVGGSDAWLPGTFELPISPQTARLSSFSPLSSLLSFLSSSSSSLSSSPLLLSLLSPLFLSLLSFPSLSRSLPPLPSPHFLSLALLPVFPSLHVQHLRVSLALSQN